MTQLCGTGHLDRRSFVKAAGLASVGWLTPLATRLARAAEQKRRPTAKSVIVLWMSGGPSQLETFDPKPGTAIGGDTRAIKTAAKGVQIADMLPATAEQMGNISLVRSVTSKEGDHERATYNVKTGFRPDPTLIHPSIGSVVCHQLKDAVEIPRHVSILPGRWPARGGYLGDQYDAFKVGDPAQPIPDVKSRVSKDRAERRFKDLLEIVEPEFARGRLSQLDRRKTLHQLSMLNARKMMSSDQLKAFDVSLASRSERNEFGDSAFGRGCLAALRLIEVGVRCVEVTLSGWDTHANNHEFQTARCADLDPGFAGLIAGLKARDRLKDTVVLCGGEFGRTPWINPAGGRDHWPHGFTVAMAGGGIAGGRVFGETSPQPVRGSKDYTKFVKRPVNIHHIHATVLHALGIDLTLELDTPVGRPMAITKGEVIPELLA